MSDEPFERARLYQSFLGRAGARDESDSYLFSEPRVRFEPEESDFLVAAQAELAEDAGGISLSSASGASALVAGASRAEVEAVLRALDGKRTLGDLRLEESLSRKVLDRVVEATFGVFVFAPLAVAELERELSGIELVRFPGAPYEIVRSYWRNMIAVRRELARSGPDLAYPDTILELLQRLHVITLMGDDLHSFYRPASPVSRHGIQPGVLFDKAPRTEETARGTRFVEGPRVNASLLGGAAYQCAICEAAGDPGALANVREHTDPSGLSWGRVVFARADTDERDAPWFCPPRPMLPAHWAALSESFESALGAAEAGDREETLGALAHFHQRFVRLHPFKAGNQSLCMNIVGFVLGRSHGAGMPHGILDHLALRLSEPAYERVFRLAAEGGIVLGTPAQRWRILAERKARTFAFVEQLSGAANPSELVRSERESARLALIDV